MLAVLSRGFDSSPHRLNAIWQGHEIRFANVMVLTSRSHDASGLISWKSLSSRVRNAVRFLVFQCILKLMFRRYRKGALIDVQSYIVRDALNIFILMKSIWFAINLLHFHLLLSLYIISEILFLKIMLKQYICWGSCFLFPECSN